jgi:Dolichyl-phosphate-mannose-protein mannosyltransferase
MWIAAWLLIGTRANVPVIDDWVYAWSVEHLLKTGRLQVLDFSAFYPIAQILWGALIARLAGFSFVALRFSTVLLSALGCWAVYLTLREIGCRRSTSMLGACGLALDPVYFALSFSFMTEVPFVCASTLALYFYVRALRRDEPKAVWFGCLCAVAAFMVRPIGIVLPLALLPPLVWNRDRWTLLRRSAAPIAIALAVMVSLQFGMPRLLGPLDWATVREGYLRWWFMIPVTSYLRWNVEVLFVSVFPLAPLLLAFVFCRRRALEVGAATIVLAIASRAALGFFQMPLLNGQTWSLHDIAARMMFEGNVVSREWALRVVPLVKLIGLVTVGALLAISIRNWLTPGHWSRTGLLVVAFAVLHLACINVLWLYNDRYYVVLAPLVAIVAAQALDLDDRAKWVASALLIVWSAISISGTRDMLAFNEAAAGLERETEASGVPRWDIDAGYALNGWQLYAHPENLPPGVDRRYGVPLVTSDAPTHYSITNSPLPNSEILRIVPLERASWQSTAALYLLRRR